MTDVVTFEIEVQPITAVFPVNPEAVQMVVQIPGPPGAKGEAGTAGGAAFPFIQASPSTTWVINHNLGYRPHVLLLSVGGVEIDADVIHTSVNQVQVNFVIPYAGMARLS